MTMPDYEVKASPLRVEFRPCLYGQLQWTSVSLSNEGPSPLGVRLRLRAALSPLAFVRPSFARLRPGARLSATLFLKPLAWSPAVADFSAGDDLVLLVQALDLSAWPGPAPDAALPQALALLFHHVHNMNGFDMNLCTHTKVLVRLPKPSDDTADSSSSSENDKENK